MTSDTQDKTTQPRISKSYELTFGHDHLSPDAAWALLHWLNQQVKGLGGEVTNVQVQRVQVSIEAVSGRANLEGLEGLIEQLDGPLGGSLNRYECTERVIEPGR